MLNRHMWLVATHVDSAGIDFLSTLQVLLMSAGLEDARDVFYILVLFEPST